MEERSGGRSSGDKLVGVAREMLLVSVPGAPLQTEGDNMVVCFIVCVRNVKVDLSPKWPSRNTCRNLT